MNMLAYDLTQINLIARINEELSTILQLIYRISKGGSRLQGNHTAINTAHDITLIWLVLFEAVSHDSLPLTGCQYVGTQTYDATRRHVKLNVHTLSLTFHRCHITLSTSNHIYHL